MLGVPVIASDAVIRPDGTVLFKSGDPISFAKQISRVINNYNNIKSNLKDIPTANNINKLIYVYNLCL